MKMKTTEIIMMMKKRMMNLMNPTMKMNLILMHGIHDYNNIDKTDILKLFQLLKSCFILREISIDDIHTQHSN